MRSRKFLQSCITALKEARALIETGRAGFVCEALDRTPTGVKANTYLKDWISNNLCPYACLEPWLVNKSEQAFYMRDERPEEFRTQMRVLRLRWIDWMISELQKEVQS